MRKIRFLFSKRWVWANCNEYIFWFHLTHRFYGMGNMTALPRNIHIPVYHFLENSKIQNSGRKKHISFIFYTYIYLYISKEIRYIYIHMFRPLNSLHQLLIYIYIYTYTYSFGGKMYIQIVWKCWNNFLSWVLLLLFSLVLLHN